MVKLVRRFRYRLRRLPRPQTCKDCWRSDGIDFYVPEQVWDAVARDCTVLCLTCFDRRAEGAAVDYSDSLVIMGRRSWLATGEASRRLEAEALTR